MENSHGSRTQEILRYVSKLIFNLKFHDCHNFLLYNFNKWKIYIWRNEIVCGSVYVQPKMPDVTTCYSPFEPHPILVLLPLPYVFFFPILFFIVNKTKKNMWPSINHEFREKIHMDRLATTRKLILKSITTKYFQRVTVSRISLKQNDCK